MGPKKQPKILQCVTFSICISLSSWVAGQTPQSPADQFQRGLESMEAGDYLTACPLIQDSYDREPKDGRLAALAKCRDGEGKIATALAHYRAYLQAVQRMKGKLRLSHREREVLAKERVRVLEMEVPRLKMVWRGDTHDGVEVSLDGRDAWTLVDQELQLDPGEHVILVRRDGSTVWARVVRLDRGASVTEELFLPKPEEKSLAVAPKKSVLGNKLFVKMPMVAKLSAQNVAEIRQRRVTGGIFLGVGIASLVAGGAFGMLALDKKKVMDAQCSQVQGRHECYDEGLSALEELQKWGNASTATLLGGGIISALGLGILLKKSARSEPQKIGIDVQFYGFGAGSVQLRGSF